MKKILVFFLFTINITAQNRYQVGMLPTLNINKNLNNNWRINYKSEFRQLISEGNFNTKNTLQYHYVQTDAAIMLSKKVGLNNKIASGFLLRFREKYIIKRAIQQFTLIKRYNGYRLGHRFTLDQTFAKNINTQWRLRYRFTTDLSLNGNTANKNEWYLKISNEYLNNFQGSNYDLEIRLIPNIGYIFNDNNKLELGLDYRINDFISHNTSGSRQRFWLVINWYIAL